MVELLALLILGRLKGDCLRLEPQGCSSNLAGQVKIGSRRRSCRRLQHSVREKVEAANYKGVDRRFIGAYIARSIKPFTPRALTDRLLRSSRHEIVQRPL